MYYSFILLYWGESRWSDSNVRQENLNRFHSGILPVFHWKIKCVQAFNKKKKKDFTSLLLLLFTLICVVSFLISRDTITRLPRFLSCRVGTPVNHIVSQSGGWSEQCHFWMLNTTTASLKPEARIYCLCAIKNILFLGFSFYLLFTSLQKL